MADNKMTLIASNDGDLRVWWVPQIPMKAFHVPVNSIHDAKLVLDTLARYDLFQYENKVKPDYCNTGGLLVFEDGEWVDWEDADGNSIDEIELSDVDVQITVL